MALAGKDNVVYVLAGTTAMSGSTGAKVNDANDFSFPKSSNIVEVPQFGEVYTNKISTLKDTTVTVSGYYDPTDTNGQVVLDNVGDTVYIGHYPQGTGVAGIQVKAIIESFEFGATASGEQTFTCTLTGIAAPEALPLRS